MVIRVPERQSNDPYAQVTSAVRTLIDDYGLRVIVDGSPNSIPPELLATRRQTLVNVEPMSREQIESIPEYQSFMVVLKAYSLTDPVWTVLGGSPADYLALKEALNILLSRPHTAEELINNVKDHLHSILSDTLNKVVLNSSTNTKEIIKVFREIEDRNYKIPKAKLEEEGFLLDYPNKVFRESKLSGRWYVAPASPAVTLIFKENIRNDNDVDNLIEKLFG